MIYCQLLAAPVSWLQQPNPRHTLLTSGMLYASASLPQAAGARVVPILYDLPKPELRRR